MANYTGPDGTVYTSPEVAKQYGVTVPDNISSGVDINTQTQQANKAISLDQLNPVAPITVPTATPTANPLEATAAGATATSKTLDQYIAELTPKPSETSKQYDSLLGDINTLLPGLEGRGQAQLEAEKAAGVPDISKKLAEVNGRLQIELAEANKSVASYEKAIAELTNPQNPQQQGIPMSAIIGAESQIRKAAQADATLRAANLNVIQAYGLSLQGQLTAAQNLANRSVDLRFSDRESTLDLKMKQLALLEGKLTKEEATTKLALERKYADEQTKIKEEKEKAKFNLELVMQQGVATKFANIAGEIVNTQTGQGWSDEASFQKDTGMTVDQAYSRGQITDVSYQKIQEKSSVINMMNQFPDAGIQVSDTLSSAQSKLSKSRIYQDAVRPPSTGNGGSTGVLGLTNQQIDNISPLVTQFQNSPIVKNYNTLGEAYNFVQTLSNNTKNPSDDQALVYAFAKAQDPDSVVREGEYATVQKYAQSWVQAYGKSVSQAINGTGFLSEEARKNMKATITTRFKTAEKSYQNLANETERRINLIGNTDKGNQLITNYGGAFTPSAPINTVTLPNTINQEQTKSSSSESFLRKIGNFLWGQ